MTSFNKNILTESGFTLANDVRPFRLVAEINGQDGGGKTHLALTAPDPICHIAFDIGGLEGMREKFVRGEVDGRKREIYEVRIRKPKAAAKTDNKAKAAVKDAAGAQWEKVVTAFNSALKSGARTIIVDQETDLWELARLKEFGTDSNVGHLYAQLNSEYKEILFSVYDYPNVNLALIRKLKKQYVSKPTRTRDGIEDKEVWCGSWEPAGFGDLRYIVNTRMMCWRDAEVKDDGLKHFHLEIGKCRQNALCDGLRLDDDSISFGAIGQLVFPESEESDWV